MRKITFDIETSNIFQDVNSNNAADLDLAVICIHDSETGNYASFEQHQLPELWPIMEKADMLITFNGDHFDIPLLNKYYPGDLTTIKSLDLLKEVRKSLGKRIKLDTIAEATFGGNKTADGLQAVRWWREGRKQEVIDYCIADVKITKDVYDYAMKHGHLKFIDFAAQNAIKEFPVDTTDWEKKEESAMTHSLF